MVMALVAYALVAEIHDRTKSINKFTRSDNSPFYSILSGGIES